MRLKDLLKTTLYIKGSAKVAIRAIFNIFAQGKDGLSVPSQLNVNFS